MRKTHACIACCTFLFVAGPVALTHCSGSSTTGTPRADGGGNSSGGNGASSGGTNSSSGGLAGDDGGGTSSGAGSSGGDDGGTSSGANEGGTSSGGGEGGTGSSGGHVTPVPEGGLPSDPNQVSCGSAICDTTTSYCCAGGADGGACTPYNSGSCASGIKVSCNEAADCSSGVCCTALAYGTHSSSCLPSCPGPGPGSLGDFQLCRTDAECGSADAGAASQKCIVQLCSATAGGPQNVTVEACAYYNIGGGIGNPGGWGPLPGCVAK